MTNTNDHATSAFEERVPLDETGEDANKICSHALFSFFTADIINENKVFVR